MRLQWIEHLCCDEKAPGLQKVQDEEWRPVKDQTITAQSAEHHSIHVGLLGCVAQIVGRPTSATPCERFGRKTSLPGFRVSSFGHGTSHFTAVATMLEGKHGAFEVTGTHEARKSSPGTMSKIKVLQTSNSRCSNKTCVSALIVQGHEWPKTTQRKRK